MPGKVEKRRVHYANECEQKLRYANEMVNCLVWKSLSSHVALWCGTTEKKNKTLHVAPKYALEIWPDSSYHINLKQVEQEHIWENTHTLCVTCKRIFVFCLRHCAAVEQHICYGNEIYIFKHWHCFFSGVTKNKINDVVAPKKRTKGKKHTPIRIKADKKCDRKIMLALSIRRTKYHGIKFYLLELELVLLPHMLCGFMNCFVCGCLCARSKVPREHNYQWTLKRN